ncbi:hypothetical protein NX801_20345 [Streptomyces sp. LP05-1]|uniref:DUF6801 domain-containing protein n=1 Tax=Streptomyces pyxinae TaxID=2970734 RepID=A0ABT2CKL8_9ACTN|nr:DUF6801 domain-containing protein [Streptomyces sp. LP05-1]MCS0637962.1 hypothetical protein [Streptomyces sp. LP05-1]
MNSAGNGGGTTGDRGRRYRAGARTAAVGGVVLVAGLLPGAGADAGAAGAGGEQAVEREFAYRCRLPGGEHPATVAVTAALPRETTAGQPVRAERVAVALRLPEEAAAELRALGAAEAAGAARLTTRVTQDGQAAETEWAQLAVPDTAIPPAGGLTLTASGAVPAVTPRTGGPLSLATGALSLDLLPRSVDGAATDPSALPVACAPAPDQDTTLATVAVRPRPGPAGPSAPPTADPPAGSAQGPRPAPAPTGGTGPGRPAGGQETGGTPGRPPAAGPGTGGGQGAGNDGPDARKTGRAVADCVENPPVKQDPKPSHGYLAGFSNVRKLKAAMFIKDPGLMRVNMAKATQVYQCPRTDGLLFTMYSDGTFDYRGKPQLPPVRSTFLTFGFMPTTATAELTLKGRLEIATGSYFSPSGQFSEVTEATGDVSIRLSGVRVNGTPLDVGPACRTARPMRLTLRGQGWYDTEGEPHGYTVVTGGPLTGTATIPEFSGCGATEDLDRIFTAALSGPGNFVKMTQGVLCSPGQPEFCPDPPRPKPER